MRANKTLRYFAARIMEFSDLTSRERDILFNRLMDKTLEKIGDKYDLTAERIRQIELSAVKKLDRKTKQLELFKERSEQT